MTWDSNKLPAAAMARHEMDFDPGLIYSQAIRCYRGRSTMSEKYRLVAKYSVPLEAELAKGFLESEGIDVQLLGDMGATMLPGLVELRVFVADAERALRLLEAHRDRVRRGDDWQDEAEQDVWVCSLCGSAVPKDRTACTDCATPRDAVQVGDGGHLQIRRVVPDDRLNQPEGITAEQPAAAPVVLEEPDGAIVAPDLVKLYGDDLARRAFLAALAPFFTAPFACVWLVALPLFVAFVAISAWYLFRLLLFNNGELSRVGWLYLVAALALNVSYIGIVVFFFLAFLPH